MVPLGNVLADLLDGLGIRQRILQARVLQIWEKAAREVGGERLAGSSRALSVKRETLFVSLESSILRHQLTFIKRDLIERLNILAGQEVISEIRISSDRRDRTEDG